MIFNKVCILQSCKKNYFHLNMLWCQPIAKWIILERTKQIRNRWVAISLYRKVYEGYVDFVSPLTTPPALKFGGKKKRKFELFLFWYLSIYEHDRKISLTYLFEVQSTKLWYLE